MVKHVTITISTRNRWRKLARCLASIPVDPRFEVYVCCDGDRETFNLLSPNIVSLVLISDRHQGSPACLNMLARYVKDGLLYLMDDAELYPDTLENALKEYNEVFPGDDGMMGIHQDGTAGSESGMALLGTNFLSRFPDKKFNYPGYWHFSDMEIKALADKLGVFHYSKTAKLKHYHPDEHMGELDQTHRDARIRKHEDFELYRQRQGAGLIYGFNDF